MSEGEKRLQYNLWLWDMWMAGYGSYRDIEAGVRSGEILPMVRPENQPRKAKELVRVANEEEQS